MASHSSSLKVIYAALAGNLAIAAPSRAAAVTGSPAMLSEAIHRRSIRQQMLLMFGMSQAERPADFGHPFGYGLQLYFWVFVVAVLIFGLGAVFSSSRVCARSPTRRRSEMFSSTIVLGLAILFETGSWYVAFPCSASRPTDRAGSSRCGAARTRPSSPCCSRIGRADRSVIRIDRHRARRNSEMPVLDGVASLGIALVLAGTAIFLATRARAADRRGSLSRSAARHRANRPYRARAYTRINEVLTMISDGTGTGGAAASIRERNLGRTGRQKCGCMKSSAGSRPNSRK